MTTVFLRVLEADDKAAALRIAIHDPEVASGRTRFNVNPIAFSAIPEAPFLYRLPAIMLHLAANGKTVTAAGAKAMQGFGASIRFHRLVWEVNPASIGHRERWLWLAHGSQPSPFFKPTYHLVLWHEAGHEAKADVVHRYPYLNGNYGFKIQSEAFYGRPGLCYGKRTGRLTVQAMPEGHIFSFEGTAIHMEDACLDPWSVAAVLNSQPVAFWLNNVCAQHKTYSYVNATPIPDLTDGVLGQLARTGWRLQLLRHAAVELSNHFALPALLQAPGSDLARRARAWLRRVTDLNISLDLVLDDIDQRCFAMYGIKESDRKTIVEGLEGTRDGAQQDGRSGSEDSDEGDDGTTGNLVGIIADAPGLTGELLAWAVGVSYGRFDVRLATGERQPPPEPDPFDPLPVCSPGMLTGDDGLPVAAPPAGYPLAFPADGVLVDDPGHASDLTARVREVFGVVFGSQADARWQEAAELVAPRDHDLRRWLAREYFGLHLRAYSKSRRRAPIYWQVGTPSGSYSVWLYYHRFSRDTLYTVLNDYVTPKLRHEERRLTALVQEVGPHPTPGQRRDIAAQEAFVDELRAFREELTRVAPLWDPDLNDGVILNFAPIWRLVPQHKAWQREVKGAWDKLAAGEYDWAHLSMHLWPERVVPKCATDRSLAIAHGLEDVFWSEGDDGKWRPRAVDDATIELLAAERTSAAAQAAVAGLGEAGGRGTMAATKRTKGHQR